MRSEKQYEQAIHLVRSGLLDSQFHKECKIPNYLPYHKSAMSDVKEKCLSFPIQNLLPEKENYLSHFIYMSMGNESYQVSKC